MSERVTSVPNFLLRLLHALGSIGVGQVRAISELPGRVFGSFSPYLTEHNLQYIAGCLVQPS